MCSRYGLTGAELSRKITSLPLPAIVSLIQPRMLLAAIPARILGWLMFLLLSAKTPCAFSAEQLSSQPVPSWCSWLGIIPSQVQDLTFISAEPHVKLHSCWPNLNNPLRSLYGDFFFQHCYLFTQLRLILKFGDSAFNPTFQTTYRTELR